MVTNPSGYVNILLNGADPSQGGSDTGSSIVFPSARKLQENAKGYFYVFKDSAFPQSPECPSASDNPLSPIPSICNTALKVVLPRLHAVSSGIASTGYPINEEVSVEKTIIGGLSGLFTPSVKFRFTPEDAQCHVSSDPSTDLDTCFFEDDTDFRGSLAYRTKHPISSFEHIGITGSLYQAMSSDIFSRMATHPDKVIIGAAFLMSAGLLAKATYDYFKDDSELQSWQKNALVICPSCSGSSFLKLPNIVFFLKKTFIIV